MTTREHVVSWAICIGVGAAVLVGYFAWRSYCIDACEAEHGRVAWTSRGDVVCIQGAP